MLDSKYVLFFKTVKNLEVHIFSTVLFQHKCDFLRGQAVQICQKRNNAMRNKEKVHFAIFVLYSIASLLALNFLTFRLNERCAIERKWSYWRQPM